MSDVQINAEINLRTQGEFFQVSSAFCFKSIFDVDNLENTLSTAY